MSASESMITAKNVDLSNCDREQIQYAGAIQPHGVLLVLKEPDLRILQASQNAGQLLGIQAETLIGRTLGNFLAADELEKIRKRLLREKLEGAPVHLARLPFAGREFDLLAHRHDQVLILEFEARPDDSAVPVLDLYSELRSAIAKLQATSGLQSFFNLAAQEIRSFTGFDRVMVYKFLEDGSGWVQAEALTEGLEPYLGLHYPPSDIPAPARRLFSLTWLRHQPDIGYRPVPMLPENNPATGGPLDMSYAFLRSVSVMYTEYLKNMGTHSSMVMTLLKDGKLWGLIACHHHTGPKHVCYEARVACEFLANMVSMLMTAKEDLENHAYRTKLKTTQTLLVENVARRADFVAGFLEDSPNLLDFVNAGGAAIVVNGHITAIGTAPAAAELAPVLKWLSTEVNQEVFATDCLANFVPEAEAFKDRCAGILALRYSKAKDDFLLWFRPEIQQTVQWAGDPHKPVDISNDGRLSPRTSFALWKETVHLKSTPWLAVEKQAVAGLRAALLELVLSRAEELGALYANLERSHAELDSFAYVASHDLKEPLRAIATYAEMLREDYADKLDAAGLQKLATLSRLAERMDQLIDALLEYSRVGHVEFHKVDVDLNQVVIDAMDLMQAHIERNRAMVKIARPLPVVQGDHIRLVEVFTNLISNAIKYSDKAAREVEIGFEPSRTGGPPIVYVRDNGIGIDKNHHEQIFEIFRRLHARNEFGGGSGAGLTIVKKIIERHGGRIWVDSTPGFGTTFFFNLAPTSSEASQ